MTGKMHVSLGIYTGVSGAALLCNDFGCQTGFILGSILGSVFPDIDSPKSILSQKIPFLPRIINKMCGHRGFFHSITLFIIFAVWFYLTHSDGYYRFLQLGFLTGYMSHIAQDLFTKGGIRLLYPFTKKRFRIGFTKSGSKIDPVITSGLAAIWTLFAMLFAV